MASNGTTERQKTGTTMLHFFHAPGYAEPHAKKLNSKIKAALPKLEAVDTKFCFKTTVHSMHRGSPKDRTTWPEGEGGGAGSSRRVDPGGQSHRL